MCLGIWSACGLQKDVFMLYIICKKYLPKSPSCDKIINVAKISRHVGMADEADSKSVGLITRAGSTPATGTTPQRLANP